MKDIAMPFYRPEAVELPLPREKASRRGCTSTYCCPIRGGKAHSKAARSGQRARKVHQRLYIGQHTAAQQNPTICLAANGKLFCFIHLRCNAAIGAHRFKRIMISINIFNYIEYQLGYTM
jgi:hypothetical protein